MPDLASWSNLWQQAGWWDTTCLCILLVSVLVGLVRGLVRETLSLLGWVLAFWGAQWAAAFVQQMLPAAVLQAWSPEASYLLAFVLAFVSCMVLARVCTAIILMGVRLTGLSGLDRLFGAGFGVLRALVLLWVVTVAVWLTPLHQADWWRKSHASGVLTASLLTVTPWLPATLRGWLPTGRNPAANAMARL